MSEKNWDEEHPTIDTAYEYGLHERELEDKRQIYDHKEELHQQRKDLFEKFSKYVPWMLLFGYVLALIVVIRPSTQGAVIAGLVIMVPVVLVLAMIRVLYGDGGGKDKTAPSIVLNVGKELANVIKSYIKSSTNA